jgi:hypothetical protein
VKQGSREAGKQGSREGGKEACNACVEQQLYMFLFRGRQAMGD